LVEFGITANPIVPLKPQLNSLIKFIPVSLLATAIDFWCGQFLVVHFQVSYSLSTLMGNLVGGVLGFLLSRYWVFKESSIAENTAWQILKYGLVSLGNSALNTFGVWLFTQFWTVDYLFVRALVGIIVFVVYSYSLNKWFVFTAKSYEKVSII
jgi:putative flippase GtrA